MIDYHNIYERLQEYFKLFSNNTETGFIVNDDYYFGMPIQQICQITHLPLDVVRKDIVGIRSWQDILSYDDDIEESLSDKLNNALDSEDSADFDRLLLSGDFDDVPIYLTESAHALYHIKLSSEEASAYYMYQNKKQKGKDQPSDEYYIKDSYRYHYIDNLFKKLELIHTAILQKSSIRIEYSPPREEKFSVTIQPLKIIYDSVENVYSILTVIDNQARVYRLDRIQSISESNFRIDISNTDILSIAPNVWGCEFNDTPHKVKVRFYNEANTWNKVRNDLSYRTNGSLYEKDGFLYYEDIVYGINSFRTWIYSYGSSAIVLEPQELREQIIQSLKLRQARVNK